jgi:hypothetical protein
MITLPSNVIALLETGRLSVRTLIRFDLAGGSQGIWNDSYALTSGGVTYNPASFQIGEIGSRSGLSSEQVEVLLSYLTPNIGSIMDGIGWHQRPVVISRAYLDDAGAVLHILPRFAGFLDAAPVSDEANGTASMTLSAESNNRELQRATERVRSDADQRLVSATDGFFKHTTASAVDSNIYWGRKGPQSPAK